MTHSFDLKKKKSDAQIERQLDGTFIGTRAETRRLQQKKGGRKKSMCECYMYFLKKRVGNIQLYWTALLVSGRRSNHLIPTLIHISIGRLSTVSSKAIFSFSFMLFFFFFYCCFNLQRGYTVLYKCLYYK